MRLANAILHTYQGDEYKDPELEVPIAKICSMFGRECNVDSINFVASLINEILDEPVAVINKVLSHKLIKWQTYDFITLLEPLHAGSEVVKLKINLDYLTITEKFVANPYLEF